MENFSMYAANEIHSNRKYKEKSHKTRGEFDRDRDRILYSKAFRRLNGKTQVFVVGNDDHMRNRLTHTLEVCQIAKTISKQLGLHETLTEAIALGHDIGHTPFGHVGERTLNYIMNGCCIVKDFNKNLSQGDKGFKHNWQGLRSVVELEQISRDYVGLNLTYYTIWGILNHSSTSYKRCSRKTQDNMCNLLLKGCFCEIENEEFSLDFYKRYDNLLDNDAWTLEGLVVAMADEIAQRHHDIEDGIEAKIINSNLLINIFEECFKQFFSEEDTELVSCIKGEKEKLYFLPALSRLIINFFTTRIINDTINNLNQIKNKFNINNNDEFYNLKSEIKKEWGIDNIVCYSKEFSACERKFKTYLKNRVLNSYKAQSMDGKADYIIRQLFKAYVTNPQQLPDKTIITFYKYFLEDYVFTDLSSKYTMEELIGYLRDRLEHEHFIQCDNRYNSILLRVICDYIAGMSDNYALEQYSLLYSSKKFS